MRNRHPIAVLLFALLLKSPADLIAPAAAEGWTGGGDSQSIQQFDFWGFSIGPEPQKLGQELELVGTIVPATTWLPFSLNFGSREYTVYVHDLILADRFQNGIGLESRYTGGYADIYEDPSFNAPFAHATAPEDVPPLDPAQVPANFMDGSLLAQMEFRNFITIFYPTQGIGTLAYTATELRLVAGSAFGKFRKHHMVVGWHMGGGFTDDPRYIPAGYGMRYDPLFRWESPLPVEAGTWGRIKAAFRQ